MFSGCQSTDSDSSSGTKDGAGDTAPATPLAKLQKAVDDSDADHPKVTKTQKALDVEFDVKDNFGNGAIQGGIAIDVFDMAERIAKAGVPFTKITFTGMFPLIDKLGNEEDGPVFRATFTAGILGKIKYDNIDNTSLDLIGDLAAGPVFLLPDLQD